MYKRVIPVLHRFLVDCKKDGRVGKYYIDCQFGRVGFVDDKISGTINTRNTRVDASGATFFVEVYGKVHNAEAGS